MADPDRNIISVFNEQVIAEFRANEGRVGGPLAGTPILLLHHIGACRHQCADGRNRRSPRDGRLQALAARGPRGRVRVRRWRNGSADALPVRRPGGVRLPRPRRSAPSPNPRATQPVTEEHAMRHPPDPGPDERPLSFRGRAAPTGVEVHFVTIPAEMLC